MMVMLSKVDGDPRFKDAEIYTDQDGNKFKKISDMIFFPPNIEIDVFHVRGLWPNAHINLQFDDNLNSQQKNNVLEAADLWREIGFTIVESSDRPFAIVQSHPSFNVTTVGYGGKNAAHRMQLVSFGDIGTVAHEIGHLIGLDHEQSRPDRNKFISVNMDNLSATGVEEFTAVASAVPSTQYDINSIMHYEQYDASGMMCNRTDQPLYEMMPGIPGPNVAGRKQSLSAIDKSGVRSLYKLT